jgi:hypothetical protein
LEQQVFEGCAELTTAKLYDINILPEETFAGDYNLETLITGTLTRVGKEALLNCSKLTDVTTDLEYVGESAFNNCGIS